MNAGVFFRTRPTKGGRSLGHQGTRSRPSATPRHLQRRKKKKGKNEEDIEKSDKTPARPNPTKSTSKPPFYATKVILQPFTHIRGRVRRVLHVHCRQDRRNVEFSNPLRSGSVRPLRTKPIQKTELGGERDSRTEENRGKTDVETTLTRRERGRQKNAGNRVKKTKSGPDPATRTESNHRKPIQHPTTIASQTPQPTPANPVTAQPISYNSRAKNHPN